MKKTVALLCLLLAACAAPTYRHPDGRGQAELDRDWYECEARFAELVSRDPMYGAVMRQRCLEARGWRQEWR